MTKRVKEDQTKNILKKEYFSDYDWTDVVGNIDLTVKSNEVLGAQPTTFLWAETKPGKNKDIYESFIQLILTIGKARTYESYLPPYFLGAADAEKIAFVDYSKVMQIFYKTDFNWNVTPSDHGTKEFRELYDLLHDKLANDVIMFKYAYDSKTLHRFIKKNFKEGRSDVAKIPVGKNNFTYVYYDWVKTVKDTIAVDWQVMQKAGILDCDFFLADLMSKDGMSIKDRLKVVLEKTKYKVLVKVELGGVFGDAYQDFVFKDNQRAYNHFWNRYERPPKPIYQRYILDRRDLLVSQDIREIKGSYYTPEQWVRLSQEYLAKVLGEDWQEEYYVWDCAAGSGNLLRGLTNKYNIYASTIDDSDVKVMHDAIDGGRLNLVKNNVFQFDFLNDGYSKAVDGALISELATCSKIPESLRKIIADPEKRKKLVIYINPPYAESSNKKTKTGNGENRDNLSTTNVKMLYQKNCGKALNELFAQFYVRIVQEIPSSTLGVFSKLKILQGSNFRDFRRLFGRRLRTLFIVPANSFDNVKGEFPIGFQIYDIGSIDDFDCITADIYDSDGEITGAKIVSSYKGKQFIIDWFRQYYDKVGQRIAYMRYIGTDFQNSGDTYITSKPSENDIRKCLGTWLTKDNLLQACVYFAVRLCIKKDWINDRDQFLYPSDDVMNDYEFVVDCLVFAIFSGQNKSTCINGSCNWIPYYEDSLNSPTSFNSRFMADYLNGKIQRKTIEVTGGLFEQLTAQETANTAPIEAFSPEAQAVMDAGKEIWRYYMSKPDVNVNASFLDIRTFFQGYKTTEKGKRIMNSTSDDVRYTELLADLRSKMKVLEAHIEPKIYEHGFLLR